MKDHVSLQERLKDLRVEKGLKLEELAEKTGISKSALASYENEENLWFCKADGGAGAVKEPYHTPLSGCPPVRRLPAAGYEL